LPSKRLAHICALPIAGWSSLVARQAHNLKVAGSNPAPATTFRFLKVSVAQPFAVRVVIRRSTGLNPRVPKNRVRRVPKTEAGEFIFREGIAPAVLPRTPMAAKYLRRQTWWVRFYHPRTGALMRGSLETNDAAKAELLRQRVELEAALLEPRFQAADLPLAVRELVCDPSREGVPVAPLMPVTSVEASAPILPLETPMPRPVIKPRTAVDDALKAYLDFIRVENSKHHVAAKLSMMRRFFGSDRVEAVKGDPASRGKEWAIDHPPFFTGAFVDEILPATVQSFMDQLEVSRKTKRHYREFFHHFFEFCMKFDFYQPTNWHNPNPVAALPSYVSRNRRIVFLTQADIEQQLRVLTEFPRLQMAVALMIYAGLRRAEMLWLTREAISKDVSYLSIVNRVDHDRDIESSLKTGDRAVTILPPLKPLIENYTGTLQGKWLIPSSKGAQWGGDSFAKKLRTVNQAAGLRWTCLHYRHTYATQRAADGWSLFRIAKEMGNSVSVVEEYYAGFIRPESRAIAS